MVAKTNIPDEYHCGGVNSKTAVKGNDNHEVYCENNNDIGERDRGEAKEEE